jgi:hypothetical protein
MKRFASILACVVALATVVSVADAGREKGPGKDTKVCPANGSVTYFETFRGGEQARVAIVGDGGTDLDLFVYDMDGRLVAQGIGLTDVEQVSWIPCWTQTYRIVVRNLGSVWNRYSLASN